MRALHGALALSLSWRNEPSDVPRGGIQASRVTAHQMAWMGNQGTQGEKLDSDTGAQKSQDGIVPPTGKVET